MTITVRYYFNHDEEGTLHKETFSNYEAYEQCMEFLKGNIEIFSIEEGSEELC